MSDRNLADEERDQPGDTRKRRNRRINTCFECQRLKRKCSRTFPCSNCQKTSRQCVFPADPWRNAATSHGSTTPSSIQSEIETRSRYGSGKSRESSTIVGQEGQTPEICLRIGKMTLGERIGGVLRSNIIEHLDAVLQLGYTGYQYGHQYSAPILAWFKPLRPLPLGRLFSVDTAPREQLTFSQEQEEALIEQFFFAVQPVCHVVSRSDLETSEAATNLLHLAVFYASACSLPLLESQKLFGTTKEALVKRLKTSTEASLSTTDIFGCLDLCTFQAVVVYLTPQLVSEVSRSHSTFIAALIRDGQIAGIDKACIQNPEPESQTKRHLWQHLLFLNARATETIGPERTIVDDMSSITYLRQASTSMDSNEWFALTRYECYRIHRLVFKHRSEIVRGSRSLSSFLQELEQQINLVKSTYIDVLDDHIPIQKYTILVGRLLLARAEGMILQTQRSTWNDGISNQGLRRRAILANLTIAECGVLLETDPDLAPWTWYWGAYHQYHSILAVLVEVHQTPNLPEAGRIMAVIDHCFGPSTETTIEARTGRVLKAIRDNLASFLTALGTSRQRNDDALEEIGLQAASSEGDPQQAFFNDPIFADFNLETTALSETEAWWQFPYDVDQGDNG